MPSTPIAIIGMACRFPRARTPEEFWNLLHGAQNASADIPPERWPAHRFFDADPAAPGKMVTRRAALIDDIDAFDAAFFGVSPREATFIDPQQRLFLEVAWEAFEDAGIPPERFSGEPVGCFVGAASNEHGMCILEDTRELEYLVPGSAYSVIANRTSYFFNFNGPSLAVDTACSSGLAAIHLACQSLRSGESTLALAGATHVLVSPWGSVAVSKMGLLSPDGYCKTFDARADGLGRGEGAGALLLKPLDRALADGDRVRAIIRGSALNQNGRSNGLYAPNPLAQEAVVRAACKAAGVAPREIEYVEAHGTGTPLGDAIEIKALGAALGDQRAPGDKCLVGSVKTNIGHLDAASGISGLVKTVLALEHRVVPAHLNFQTPAAAIDFSSLPFEVPREATPWREEGRGLAGVHAFGLGGANAHVILQWNAGAPAVPIAPEWDIHVLAISAKSEPALRALGGRHVQTFQQMADDPAAVADTCYSAGTGRARLTHRLAIVGRRPSDFAEVLQAIASGETPSTAIVSQCRIGREPRLGFRFGRRASGAAHPAGFAAGNLLHVAPAFRESVERSVTALREQGHSFSCETLMNAQSQSDARIAQVSHRVLQIALADLLRTWGIVANVAFDDATGEAAARYATGRLDLGQALRSALEEESAGASRESGRAMPDATLLKQADVWIEIDPDFGAKLLDRASPTPDAGRNPAESLMRVAGELFVRGAPVDWRGIYRGAARSKVDLPFYAFQRKRFTLLGRHPAAETAIGTLGAPAQAAGHDDSAAGELRTCTAGQRPALAARYVDRTTRRILRLEDGELDMQLPLLAMGFDSIMATELTNALKRDFDFEVPVVAFLEGISLQGVVDQLCRHVAEGRKTAAGEWDEGEI